MDTPGKQATPVWLTRLKKEGKPTVLESLDLLELRWLWRYKAGLA